MEQLKKRFRLLTSIIEAFIKEPETVNYPFGELDLPETFRGEILFDPDKCIGCGLCVRNCPADALQMNKKSRDEFRLIHYPARCAYCGQCGDNCRHGAISHSSCLVAPIRDPEGYMVVLHERKEETNA